MDFRSGGVREMLAISLPMVVSQACDTVMVFTDRLFLARLGPELMSASMGGGLTVFMMVSFFFGLTGYTTALVAQCLGAGRRKDCGLVTTQALLIAAAAYVPILCCRPLGHRLFALMGVGPGQLGPQNLYFDILLWGCCIGLFRNCLSGFFSGIGRTGIVMAASCTAMAVNTALGYCLIFGRLGLPALGIRGAAFGTIAGGLSGLLILGVAYLGKKNREEFGLVSAFRFDRAMCGMLLRLGSSPGLEMFLNLLAFDAVVLIFHSHGPATATAATIMFNWDMVSFVPLIGVEIGVTSLVGRFMGAGSPETAERSVRAGIRLGLAYSAVILALFAGCPGLLVDLFRPAEAGAVWAQARPLAVFMVRLAALYVLADAVLIVYIGALRGAGDTLWAMGMSVGLHWTMVAALLVLFRGLGAGPEAAWAAMVALFLLFSSFVYLRYRAGAWKKIRLFQPEPVCAPGQGFHETPDL